MADHKKTIVVCDNDDKTISSIQTGLAEHDYEVRSVTNPDELVEMAESHLASVIIVNPDMPNFNAKDTCKYLKKEFGLPIVFLMDRDSTTRVALDGCNADDVVTKPVKLDDLAFLVSKHITMHHS